MATTKTRARRVSAHKSAHKNGASSAVTRFRDQVATQAARLSNTQWTAIAIGAGVVGGAVLMLARPRLARRLIGGSVWLSGLPFAPPLLAEVYSRAKDRVAPLLAKPAALLR